MILPKEDLGPGYDKTITAITVVMRTCQAALLILSNGNLSTSWAKFLLKSKKLDFVTLHTPKIPASVLDNQTSDKNKQKNQIEKYLPLPSAAS